MIEEFPMKRSLCLSLGLATSLALGLSLPGAIAAHASDMPARAPAYYKAPPAAQSYDWTGFYLGLNGGYARGRTSWSDPAAGTDSGRFNTNGGLIGGQLGYNWQTGPLVLGVETDGDWMNIKGSTAGVGTVCANDGGGSCQTQQSWLGTTRARVGYAFDRWLPYITGGAAYGNVQAVQPTGTSTDTKLGWAAGAGLEYGINRNWSAKVEYLHVDLGTATFMGAASATPTLAVPVKNDLARVGINYHW
jgi:outer membrane immunogenic protein